MPFDFEEVERPKRSARGGAGGPGEEVRIILATAESGKAIKIPLGTRSSRAPAAKVHSYVKLHKLALRVRSQLTPDKLAVMVWCEPLPAPKE